MEDSFRRQNYYNSPPGCAARSIDAQLGASSRLPVSRVAPRADIEATASLRRHLHTGEVRVKGWMAILKSGGLRGETKQRRQFWGAFSGDFAAHVADSFCLFSGHNVDLARRTSTRCRGNSPGTWQTSFRSPSQTTRYTLLPPSDFQDCLEF